MSTNKSNANSSSRQKWGRGSVSDQCTANQNTNSTMAKEDNINNNDNNIDMFAEIGKELAQHTNTNDDNEVLEIPRQLEEDNNTKMDIEKLSIHSGVNNNQPPSNVDLEIPRELDIPVVPVANNNNNNVSSTGIPQQIQLVDTTQNINTQTGSATTQQQSNKKQKRGANSTVKKLSPPRHSFQSSTVKPKSTNKKKSTFKTPAGSKFPSRDLFSQRSTAKKSIAIGTTNNISTTQRKKRHSFRPSIAEATTNNTPAAPKSKVKEMRFVPTFLTNNSKTSPPKETVPIDDNDNDDGDTNNHYSDRDVFAQNMVSSHHQAKQQARKSESSKSGYLVQRLRSLRNTEQRMAMKLRNSQLSSGLSGGGGGGGIRKRRRTSGGNNLCASSKLDVTVSGRQLLDSDATLLGEGKSVLLAYIHQHTMTKQPSDNDGEKGGEECNSKGVCSCYAWIVMSHGVMREQGLLDGSTNTLQLRIYDAVVIPPKRVVNIKTGSMMASGDTNQTKCDMHRPTIVCTHISQAYPTDQPPLQDVSFDQFSS